MAGAPTLSLITTCKGRLEHLKASLHGLMALEDCEVIVVDYDCPDGAGAWVAEAFPAARVVAVRDRPIFNLAKARNLGAAEASAPWLFFVDADVVVQPSLLNGVRPLLEPGVWLQPAPGDPELSGSVIVARADFEAIGGYDEVFEGWGSEDVDLYARLALIGRALRRMPEGEVCAIRHDSALRTRFHADGDIARNSAVNALYAAAKADLMRMGAVLDEATRRALYEQAKAGEASGSLALTVRRGTVAGRPLTLTFSYALGPAEPRRP